MIRAVVLIAVVGLATFPSTAAAQTEWPKFVVHVGALIADVGSNVRVDGSAGENGTTIDFERDVGLNNQATTLFIDGTWRMSRRNRLLVNYERVNRDVTRNLLTRTITFRGRTFSAGGDVTGFYDSLYVSVDYGYAFVAKPSVELVATIGVTLLRLHSGIGLAVQGDSGGSVSRDLSDNTEFIVPVPLPGIVVNVRPHSRVTIIGYTQLIKATVHDTTATFVEAKAGVDYRIGAGVGAGVAYYYNRSIADRQRSSTNGRMEYSFNGPQVYVAFAF